MMFPLFTLLVEDGHGSGQPVAFGVMVHEDQLHIESFLRFFSTANAICRTECVVVDKDLAEINAVRSVWPSVRLIVCYFHVLKAVDRHLTAMRLSDEQREKCFDVSMCQTASKS